MTSFLVAANLEAQAVRVVEVDGRQARVQTSGLDDADRTGPIVVFEGGLMLDGLSAWTSILEDVAEFAPVVAYDRAGIGGSEPDGQPPTPGHVTENLHALLGTLGAEPPYVLVGHSLGGPFIRMYAALYPEEIAGLVYIDPTVPLSSEAQRDLDDAMGLSEESRRRLDAVLRERYADLPAAVRAEAQMALDQREAHWPEFQRLPPMPDVPVTVLMAARYDPRPDDGVARSCVPRECHERMMEFKRSWLAEVAAEVTDGILTVAWNAGHFIQNDDPGLVIWSIRRVVEAEPIPTPVAVPRAVLAKYVGVYELTPERRLAVTLEDGQLFAQITGQSAAAIFPKSETEFYYRIVDAQIRFVSGPDEDVTELILHQNERDTAWQRVP